MSVVHAPTQLQQACLLSACRKPNKQQIATCMVHTCRAEGLDLNKAALQQLAQSASLKLPMRPLQGVLAPQVLVCVRRKPNEQQIATRIVHIC